jgi:hypothetical protein
MLTASITILYTFRPQVTAPLASEIPAMRHDLHGSQERHPAAATGLTILDATDAT